MGCVPSLFCPMSPQGNTSVGSLLQWCSHIPPPANSPRLLNPSHPVLAPSPSDVTPSPCQLLESLSPSLGSANWGKSSCSIHPMAHWQCFYLTITLFTLLTINVHVIITPSIPALQHHASGIPRCLYRGTETACADGECGRSDPQAMDCEASQQQAKCSDFTAREFNYTLSQLCW